MTPLDAALLAQAAYDDTPDIGTAKSAGCCIVRDADVGRVIAFPGTDSFTDLLTDFSVGTDAPPLLGPVHGGFWSAYASIKEQIIEAVSGHLVVFIGHSLGAALATIAAADFRANGNPVVGVYAFAPPKVSPSQAIANVLVKTPVFQYRKGNDIVPTVPPAWFHGSRLMKPIGQPSYPFLNLKDHALAGYISALQNGPATSA